MTTKTNADGWKTKTYESDQTITALASARKPKENHSQGSGCKQEYREGVPG